MTVAALDLATRLDLDLVPMDEATVPATYRVVDYGKWRYEPHRNGDEAGRLIDYPWSRPGVTCAASMSGA